MFFFDQLLTGTPFRGLVIKGFAGFCAYIGVPKDHCLADMEGLEFDCHRGITFRGPGGDGIRPEGWYWYGWDYQHAGDHIALPENSLDEIPPELASVIQSLHGGKKWTIPEIEQDLIDAAVELMGVLGATQIATDNILGAAMKGASNDSGPSNT